MKVDWNGTFYLGITLAWNYMARTVDLSMPRYVQRALTRINHPRPTRDQHVPHSWVPLQHGAVTQITEEPDVSEPLVASDLKRLQQIIGVFLYYARILDSMMLDTVGTLASAQSKGTSATMRAAIQLLNDAAPIQKPQSDFMQVI
jgi:hypothetical protein